MNPDQVKTSIFTKVRIQSIMRNMPLRYKPKNKYER